MNYLLKKVGFLLAFTILTNLLFAQTSADTSKRYEKKSFRTWSIGLNAGVTSPFTPFNDRRNGDYKTTQAEWGYGAYIKKQILPGFGLQADFFAGEVKGRRSTALPDNTAAQDASQFRTHIDWSGAVSANFTVANLSLNHKHSFLSPYFTAGAGYMSSKANVTNTPAGSSTNFNHNWFIPIGAGFKLNVAKGLNLDFGYKVNFMKTNDFDGVSSARNDKFSYAHAGIEIALGKRKSSQLQNYSAAAAMREANAAESKELRSKIVSLEQQRLADQQQYASDMMDDDQDGVANKFDKCPATPSDTAVNGAGCPIKIPAPVIVAPQVTERIIVTAEDRRVLEDAIKNLEFELGKSAIKATSNEALNRVAAILVQKNFTLKLAGHTDNIGSAAANLKLSKDRAESVKAYLVSQGANPSRIEATGYGAAQPIAENKTAEGRQKNRRVEFTIF